ncbi:MAG: RNA polymerase sigma factor [Oscillospiraceae bacterium]|nr:RNA polymerase sigma factor [Oscillospiraceae bacterium]
MNRSAGVIPHADESLITRIAHGDQTALAVLYERYREAVFGFALSGLRDRDLAEDALQETFLQVWSAAVRYVVRGVSPLTWLLGITKNVVRTMRRKQLTLLDENAPEIPEPTDRYLTVENRMVTRAVLQKLSEAERQIVMLHAVAGLKHREIAELLELPLSTVLSKYNRSLKKLRSMLEETL